jgi:galactose mutarotase-like enzyme
MDFLNKLSNISQWGGIETSILDNGPSKGVRIAWFNTGTGLRFKVIIDRGMDIGEAFFNENSLAWMSHLGVSSPQPAYGQGMDWLKNFSGGLLTTCGLSHTGRPENDEFGNRGLHGNYSNIPSEIISIQQPDPQSGNLTFSMTGIVRETSVFGHHLELKRTISCALGQAEITIHDEVINRGNLPAPHMILYHINCGWPLIDKGTDIVWNGDWKAMHSPEGNTVFNAENNYKICPDPMESHSGLGEDVAFIEPVPNSEGICQCGFVNQNKQLGFLIEFSKEELPWLTNWQHWGKHEYVCALEPGTNPPMGQSGARKQGQLIELAPGEKKIYTVKLKVLKEKEELLKLLKINHD